jgi:hypothetical protein
MANSYIEVTPGTGAKMQTVENTVSGNSVHAEAVYLVDSTGTVIATLPVSIASALTVELSTGTVVHSTALEASHVLKNAAGRLVVCFGYSNKASKQFIQLHDAAALPADGAVPIGVFAVPAQQNFSIDVQLANFPFSTGIVICNSSTADTKTIGAADCFFTAVVI